LEKIMGVSYELHAETRQDAGRGASRRLRRESKIPAILYGAEKAPENLTLNHFEVTKALQNEGFYSHILTLHIGAEKQQAVLKDIQRHPFKPRIMHIDFLRINPKEKIVMHVPLHFIGEDKAPGIKEGGVFTHMTNSLEVRCLPTDLPEYIEVDVSGFALDQIIHLSELKLPKGVELMAFAHGHAEAHDTGVVKLQLPKVIEEEVPVEEEAAVSPAEVPATQQSTPVASAVPAEKGKSEGKK
jgi:large subunit ribosomal protein L25